VTISLEKYFKQRKKAINDIHPRTFDITFMVRVGTKVKGGAKEGLGKIVPPTPHKGCFCKSSKNR